MYSCTDQVFDIDVGTYLELCCTCNCYILGVCNLAVNMDKISKCLTFALFNINLGMSVENNEIQHGSAAVVDIRNFE